MNDRTQRVTIADLEQGRIRIPIDGKGPFPTSKLRDVSADSRLRMSHGIRDSVQTRSDRASSMLEQGSEDWSVRTRCSPFPR